MNGIDDFDGIDEAEVRRQRAIAREIRKTRWWQRKTAAGQCHYCGKKTAYKNLTMDHVLPLTRGGKSTKDNLVPCCKSCNTVKKSMMPLQWQEFLEKMR